MLHQPGIVLQPPKPDSIHTVQSIDWGLNHCVFVDKKNRLFTMGQNRYGKTGLAMNEEQIARLHEQHRHQAKLDEARAAIE